MATFFADMPWLNIPEERRTVFVAPPQPRGGLLGGSSTPKLSKLQALAAARKRKAEEEAALVLLPKSAHSSREERPANIPLPSGDQQIAKMQDFPRTKTRDAPVQQNEVKKDKYGQEDALEVLGAKEETLSWSSRPRSRPQTDGTFDETQMARPSAFAQVLCSRSASAKFPAPSPGPQTAHVAGTIPWAAFTTPEALREAFEQPSPDDIVLAAQAQSALTQPQPKSAPSREGSRK